MKKYGSERKGRRRRDTVLEYDTAKVIARQEPRTSKTEVRATRSRRHEILTRSGSARPIPVYFRNPRFAVLSDLKNLSSSSATFCRPVGDGWVPSGPTSSQFQTSPSLRPRVPSVQR